MIGMKNTELTEQQTLITGLILEKDSLKKRISKLEVEIVGLKTYVEEKDKNYKELALQLQQALDDNESIKDDVRQQRATTAKLEKKK